MSRAEFAFTLSPVPLAPLDSVRLKLDWAQRHLKFLDFQLSSFCWDDNESNWRDDNANAPDKGLHKPFRMPPLGLWSLILGDAIHNLRSSLDHIVYALALRGIKAQDLPESPTGVPPFRS